MIGHKLLAATLALALSCVTASAQSPAIVGSPIANPPGWMPTIRPFLSSSLYNTKVVGGTTFTPFAWPTPTGGLYFTSAPFQLNIAQPTDPYVLVTIGNNSWGTIGDPVLQITAGVTGAATPDQHLSVINTYSSTLTGSINGSGVLIVTAQSGTPLAASQDLTGSGLLANTTIIGTAAVNSAGCSPACTGAGSTGTYALLNTTNISSEAMTAVGVSYWDFQQFVRVDATHATATSQAYCNIYTSNGYGTVAPFKGCGTSATGVALLAGLVTQADLDSGVINHAISISLLNTYCQGPSTAIVTPPAIRGDCNGTGIKEGQHLAIPTGTTQPMGLSPVGVLLFVALLNYGAYVTDNGGSFSMPPLDLSISTAERLLFIQDIQVLTPLLQLASP